MNISHIASELIGSIEILIGIPFTTANTSLMLMLQIFLVIFNDAHIFKVIIVWFLPVSVLSYNTVRSLEKYASFYLRARNFRKIGYLFYIRRDGTMTQHRMLLEVGAHAVPYNHCSIGICYEGGLDDNGLPCDTRTPAQTERLTDLLTILHKMFHNAKIVGHRDLPGTSPKSCPCCNAHEVFGYIEKL